MAEKIHTNMIAKGTEGAKQMQVLASLRLGALIVLVGSILLWAACNKKNIDLKPSLPTEQNYFQTEQQFDQGVIGIYSKLVFFYNYRGGTGQDWLHDVRLLPDDDITTNWLSPFESFTTLQTGNRKVYDYYTFLYQLNARANNMLDVFREKAKTVYKNDALKDWHQGEMLFLRGYSHFQLWNLYGIAPLINWRINNDSLLYTPNSSGTQLLDAAIKDFTAAAALLPDSWPDPSYKGRVTRAAAAGMAGKACIYRATVSRNLPDYQLALQHFNNVKGFILVANYGDNFRRDQENNSESVFEIQVGDNANQEGSNPWLDTDQFDGNGDISGYWGFFDNHWSFFGGSRFLPTASLKNAFANDPRKEYCFNNDGIVKYVKGSFGGDGRNFAASYTNNARILRFADVLLLRAEALLQSGGSTTEAIQLINQIRSRARQSASMPSALPADYPTSESDRKKIMKWIIEERRIELAFEEGHRWFDLRRWHMGGVLRDVYGRDLEQGWDFGSMHAAFSFSAKNLYLPIPFEELQLNPRLKQHDDWQ